MFRSRLYTEWLDECVAIIRRQGVTPIKGKYKLVVCVRRPDKRRRDIDNVATKALNDLLQKADVVEDDCLCQMLLCAWVDDGPDTLISICSEGDEHELSAAIERALQGGQGTPKDGPGEDSGSKGSGNGSHFKHGFGASGRATASEYRAFLQAGAPVRAGRKKAP